MPAMTPVNAPMFGRLNMLHDKVGETAKEDKVQNGTRVYLDYFFV